MTTKRAAKSAEQPSEQPEQKAAEPQAQLYKCSAHLRFFADEDPMLPLDAFPIDKATSKRRGSWCRRCQVKQHTAYAKRRREEERGGVEYWEQQIAKKQAELDDLKARLEAAVTQAEADAEADAEEA